MANGTCSCGTRYTITGHKDRIPLVKALFKLPGWDLTKAVHTVNRLNIGRFSRYRCSNCKHSFRVNLRDSVKDRNEYEQIIKENTRMRRVYRYEITPSGGSLRLPKGSKLLSVAYWKGQVSLWVDQPIGLSDDQYEDVPIWPIGTGHDIPAGVNTYIGTVLMPDTQLVFHFYTK